MIKQNEIVKNITERVNEVAVGAGFLVLAAATASGSIHMPNHEEDKRAVLVNRPSVASHAPRDHGPEPSRHEREEPAPHYTSYGANQRTPARSSK